MKEKIITWFLRITVAPSIILGTSAVTWCIYDSIKSISTFMKTFN